MKGHKMSENINPKSKIYKYFNETWKFFAIFLFPFVWFGSILPFWVNMHDDLVIITGVVGAIVVIYAAIALIIEFIFNSIKKGKDQNEI